MAAPAPPPPVVHQTSDAREESALSDLIAMGFARGAALTALRHCGDKQCEQEVMLMWQVCTVPHCWVAG